MYVVRHKKKIEKLKELTVDRVDGWTRCTWYVIRKNRDT